MKSSNAPTATLRKKSPVLAWFRRHLRVPVTGLLMACFALWSTQVKGATYIWDPDANAANNVLNLSGAAPAAATLGGAGTWNNANVNWWNGSTDQAWVNANADTAWFAGLSGGVITAGNAMSAGGLTFTTGGYTTTLTGANTLTLVSTPIILTAASATIGTNSINGVLGTTGFVKNGGGTLTVLGTNTGFSGGVAVNGGALTLNGGANLGQTQLNTSTITMNFGTLNILNNGAGSNTAAAIAYGNNIVINGNSTIAVNNAGANTNNTISIPSLSLNNSTVTVSSTSGYGLQVTGATTLAGAISTINSGFNPLQQGAAGIAASANNTASLVALTGAVSGGTLNKSGTGTVTLQAANTYTGGTNILAGSLLLNTNAATLNNSTGGNVIVNPGATLGVVAAGNVNFTGSQKLYLPSNLGATAGGVGILRVNANADVITGSTLGAAVASPYGASFQLDTGTAGVQSAANSGAIFNPATGAYAAAANYSQNIDLNTIGSTAAGTGRFFLGSTAANTTMSSVVSNTAGGSTDDVRFGGTGQLILTATNSLGTTAQTVQIGSPINNAGNAVQISSLAGTTTFNPASNNSNYTGTMVVNRFATLSSTATTGTNPFGAGAVTVYGGTVSLTNVNYTGSSQLANSAINLYPAAGVITGAGSLFTIDDSAITTAGGTTNARIAATVPVNAWGGSTFSMVSSNTAATTTSQGLGTYTFRGGNVINLSTNTTAANNSDGVLTISNLVRSGNGTMTFTRAAGSPTQFGTSSANNDARIVLTQLNGAAVTPTATAASSMLPAWLVEQTASTFLTHGANGIVPVTYDDTNFASPAGNKLETATGALSPTATVFALQITGTTAFTGGTVTINPTGAPNSDGAGLIITGAATHATNFVFGAGAGDREGLIYNSAAVTLSGALSSTVGITKFGTANLTLTGANTGLGGTITVNQGALLGSTVGYNFRPITLASGQLDFSSTANGIYLNDVTVAGEGLISATNGQLPRINSMTIAARQGTGTAPVNLQINSGLVIGNYGTTYLSGSGTAVTGGGLVLSASVNWGNGQAASGGTAGANLQNVLGVVSGAGTINKYGNAALSFSNASNTFNGGIVINGAGGDNRGAVRSLVGTASGTPFGTGSITINPGGVLTLSAPDNASSNAVTFNSDLSGLPMVSLQYGGSAALPTFSSTTFNNSNLGSPFTGVLGLEAVGFSTSINMDTLWNGRAFLGGSNSGGSATGAITGSITPSTVGLLVPDLSGGQPVAGNNVYRIGAGGGSNLNFFGASNQFTGATDIMVGAISNVTGAASVALQLGNANTFVYNSNNISGNVYLNSGVLVAGRNDAFGAAKLVFNGGGIQADAGTGTPFYNTIRTLSNGIGLTGDATFAGSTDLILSGAVSLADNQSGVTRTLTVSNTAGITYLTGIVSNGGGTAGANNITKAGAGPLVMSGANTYTGFTNINAGTLLLTSDSGIPSASKVTLGGGSLGAWGSLGYVNTTFVPSFTTSRDYILTAASTFDVGPGVTLTQQGPSGSGSGFTQGSNISGAFALTKAGLGTLTLNGINSMSGVNITNGILQASGGANLGDPNAASAITVNGGTFRPLSTFTTNRPFTATTGSVDVPSGVTMTLTGVISGANFVKTGPGTFVNNTGTNTETVVVVQNGTLSFNGTNTPFAAAAALDVNGGIYQQTNTGANQAYATTATLSFGGGGTVKLQSGTGFSSQLTAANINRSVSGTLIIDPGTSALAVAGNTNNARLIPSTLINTVAVASANVNGMLPGSIVTQVSGNGSFATYTGATTGIGSFSAYTTVAGATLPATTTTSVIDVTGAVTAFTSSTQSVYALRAGADISGGTLKFVSVNGLTATNEGGLIINGSRTIGANLTFDPTATTGGSAASGEGLIYVNPGSTATISGGISATSLVKFGSGDLVLSGANTKVVNAFSVNNGTLKLGGGLTFDKGQTDLVLTNTGKLDVDGGRVTFNSLSNGAAVVGGIAGGTVTNNNATAGTFVINTMNSATSATFAGQINDGTGTVALAKSGLGTAILAPFTINAPDAGNNSLSGGVTLNQGTLTIQDPRAVGSGTITLQGGQVNGTTLTGATLSLLSNGPGINSTIVVGNGSANVTGVNVVSNGYTTINADRISANSGNVFQFNNLALNEGQLNFTNGNTYHVRFAGTTTLAGGFGTINVTGGDFTASPELAGVIGGAGTLNKLGSNYYKGLIISGTANTYTGGTNIQSGYVQVTGTSGTPLGTGTVQVYPGAALRIGANIGAAGTIGGAPLRTLSRWNSFGIVALDNDDFNPASTLNSTSFSNAYGTVLAITRPFYAGSLDQSTIGDGRSILAGGLNQEVGFLGTLAPGLGDGVAPRAYRVAGGNTLNGGERLVFLGADNQLNDLAATGTSLIVGSRQSLANNGLIQNAGQTVIIRNSNSYSGGTWIGKGSTLQIETGGSPAGSTPLGSSDGTLTGSATTVEIFGTLQNTGVGSSFVNAATGKNSITPLIRPAGGIIVSDQIGIAAGGQGRWADSDANGGAVNLGTGFFQYNGAAGLPSVEQIGTLTVSGNGRVMVNRQNDAGTATLILSNLTRVAPGATGTGIGGGTLTIEPRQGNAATAGILGIPNLATTQLQQAAGFVRLLTNSSAPSLGGTTVNGTGVTNSGMAPAWIIDSQANSFVTYNPTAANTGFQPLVSSATPNPGQVSYNKIISAALTAGQLVTGDIVDLQTTGNTLVDATTTIYAMRIGQSLNATATANTLNITSGGLLFNNGAAVTINASANAANTVPVAMTLQFGGGTGEGFIYKGTAFDQTINANISASNLTIFANQGNNNTLILTGINNLTGPVTANSRMILQNTLSNTGVDLGGIFNNQDVILGGAPSRDNDLLRLTGVVDDATGGGQVSNSSAMSLYGGTFFVNGDARIDANGTAITQRLTNLNIADRGIRSPGYLYLSNIYVQGTTSLGVSTSDTNLFVNFDGFANTTLAGVVQGGQLSKFANGTLLLGGTANTFASLVVNGSDFNTATSIVGSITPTGSPFGSGPITVNPGGSLRIMNASNIASNSSIDVKSDEQGLGSIAFSTNLTQTQVNALFGTGAGKVNMTSTHPTYIGGVMIDANSLTNALSMASMESTIGGSKKLVLGSSINPLQTSFNNSSVIYYAGSLTSSSDDVFRLAGGGNQGSLAFGVGTFENIFGAGKNIEIGAASSTNGASSTPLVNGNTGLIILDTRNTTFNGNIILNQGGQLSIENAAALGSGTLVFNQGSGVNGTFSNGGFRAVNSQTVSNNISVVGDMLNLISGGDNAQFTGTVNLNPTGGVGGTKWFGVNGNASGNVGTSTNVAFNGVISGTGVNIIKGGSNTNNGGNWILRGANTYSGSTTIVSGTLTADGDVLPNVAGPFGISDTPIALGNVGTQSAGSLQLSGQYTFGRGIIDTGITGNIAASIRNQSANNAVVTGGILLNRAAVTGGGLAIEAQSTGANAIIDLQGPITGPGSIQIGVGATGYVRLSANANGISTSTFAGGVNIFNGRVQVAADPSFTGTAASPTIISSPFGTGTLFLGRQGSNTSGIANQNAGTIEISPYGGDRVVVNPLGALQTDANTSIIVGGKNNLTFSNSTAFDIHSGATLRNRTWQINTPGVVTVGASMTSSGAQGANMLKAGIGTLVLTGTNTQYNKLNTDANYGTSLFIDGGVLSVGADANLGETASIAAGGTHLVGPADIKLRGGALQVTGTFSTARQFFLTAGSGLDVTGANTFTMSTVTTGAFALTKYGTGTLALNPAANANNTITTLTIGGFPGTGAGTVSTTNTAGTPFATSTVALLGGTLGLVGGASAQSLTVPTVTFGSGSRISLNRGTTTTLLTATALTRANRGTLILQPTTALADLGAAANFAQLKTSSTFTTTNNMLATPTVVVQDPSSNDLNFVQLGANGFTLHTNTGAANNVTTAGATVLADLSSANTLATGNVDVYAVRTSANIAQTDATSVLRIVNGGLILNGTGTPPSIQTKLEFDAGTAGTPGEALVYVRGGQTGSSSISNGAFSNGFTATDFTKSGPGTLLINSTSNVMAPTSTVLRNISINEGTLQFGGQTSVPQGGLVTVTPMDAGVFDLAGQSLTIASLGNGGATLVGTGNVSNSGSSASLTLSTNNQTATFNGLISGNISVVKSGFGTQIFGVNNFAGFGGNTYTGGTTINAGQITSATGILTPVGTLQGVGINSFGTGGITLQGGILSFNNTNAANEIDHGVAILTQGPNNGYDVTITSNNNFGTANTTSTLTNANTTAWLGINSVTVQSGAFLNFGGGTTNVQVKGQTSFAANSTINTGGSAVLGGKVSASGLTLNKIGGNTLFLMNTDIGSGASAVGAWNFLAGTVETRMSDGGSNPMGTNNITLNGASWNLRHDGDNLAAAQTLSAYNSTLLGIGSTVASSNPAFISSVNSTLDARTLSGGTNKTVQMGQWNFGGTLGSPFLTFSGANNYSVEVTGALSMVNNAYVSLAAASGNTIQLTLSGGITGNGTFFKQGGSDFWMNSQGTNTGGTMLYQGVTSFGSFIGNTRTLNDTSGARFAPGDITVNIDTVLRFNSTNNLNGSQRVDARGNYAFYPVIGIGSNEAINAFNVRAPLAAGAYNSNPLLSTSVGSGVIAINSGAYAQTIDMGKLGDGTWFLGSTSNGSGSSAQASLNGVYTGSAAIGASTAVYNFGSSAYGSNTYNSNAVYRLGGGNNTFTAFLNIGLLGGTNNTLTNIGGHNPQNVSLVVGNGALASSNSTTISVTGRSIGNIFLNTNQNYSGYTLVNISSQLEFRGTMATAGYETFGTLVAGGTGASFGSTSVTMRPGSVVRLDNTLDLNSSASGRWADTAPVNLNSSTFRVTGNASVDLTEVVGTVNTTANGFLTPQRSMPGRSVEINVAGLTRTANGFLSIEPSTSGQLGTDERVTMAGANLAAQVAAIPGVGTVSAGLTNGMVAPWLYNNRDSQFLAYSTYGFVNAGFNYNNNATSPVSVTGGNLRALFNAAGNTTIGTGVTIDVWGLRLDSNGTTAVSYVPTTLGTEKFIIRSGGLIAAGNNQANVTVTAGLQFGATGSPTDAFIAVPGQTFVIGDTANPATAGQITASSIVKGGAGALQIDSEQTGFTGNIYMNNGSLTLRTAASSGTLNVGTNGGTIFFGGVNQALNYRADNAQTLNHSLALNAGVLMLNVNVDRINATSSGNTISIGSLTFGGTPGDQGQTLTVSGGNTYAFRVNGTTDLGPVGNVFFNLTNANNTAATLAGAIIGSGTLIREGASSGSLFLGTSGVVPTAGFTGTGGITILSGTVQANAVPTTAGANSTINNALSYTGTGPITLAGGQLSLRVDGDANATNRVYTFPNTITVTGNTTINVDRIGVAAGSNKTLAFPALNIGGQTLTVSAGNTYSAQFNAVNLSGTANMAASNDFIVQAVSDKGAGLYMVKNNGGTLWFNDNTSSFGNVTNGGLYINNGLVRFGNPGAASSTATAGTQAVQLNPQGGIRVDAAANLPTAGQLTALGTSWSMPIVRLGTALTQANVTSFLNSGSTMAQLRLEAANSNALTMSGIGDGALYLGTQGSISYTGNTLGAGAASIAGQPGHVAGVTGTYRLGSNDVLASVFTLAPATAANKILTGNTQVVVGSQAIGGNNGTGTVLFNNDNDYSAGTIISRGSEGRIQTGTTNKPLGTGQVDVFGTLRAVGANGSFIGSGTTNNNAIVMHPGSAILLDGTGSANNANRWGNSDAVALNGSSFTMQTLSGTAQTEVVGAVTFQNGSRLGINNPGSPTGANQLTIASLTRTGTGTLVVVPADIFGTNAANTDNLVVTGGLTTVGGGVNMLPAYIVDGDSGSAARQSFVTDAGGGSNRMVNVTYTDTNFAAPTNAKIGDVTANTTLAGDVSIFALRVGAFTISNAPGQNNTITLNQAATAGGGILTNGAAVINPNLNFNGQEAIIASLSNLTLNGDISNVSSTGITKFGGGALTIGKDQTDAARGSGNGYSNGWTINEGQLTPNTFGALGNAVSTNVVRLNASTAAGGNANGIAGAAVLRLTVNAGNPSINYYSMGDLQVLDAATISYDPQANDRVSGLGAAGSLSNIVVTSTGGFLNDAQLFMDTNRDRSMLVAGNLQISGTNAGLQLRVNNSAQTSGTQSGLSVNTLVGASDTRLLKIGNAELHIRGDSSASFSGAVNIEQGSIGVYNNGSLGSGTTTVKRFGVLDVQTANYVATGTIAYQAGGIERWSVDGARTGSLNLGAATLQVNNDQTANTLAVTMNGGSIEAFLRNDDNLTGGQGQAVYRTLNPNITFTLAGNSFVGQNINQGVAGFDNGRAPSVFNPQGNSLVGAVLEIKGIISGSGGLTKQGYDVVTLSGANTYSGGTTVLQGLLRIGANNALPSGGKLTTTGGGMFDLNGYNVTLGQITSPASGLTAGTLNAAGSGYITNTALDTTKILSVGNGTNGSAADFAYGGVIQYNIALEKNGPAVLSLTNANTYNGGTTLNAGWLQAANTLVSPVGSATGSGAVSVAGGTLSGAGTISGLVTLGASGAIQPGALTLGAVGSPTSNAGVLTLGGLIVNGGAFTFQLGSVTGTNDRIDLTGVDYSGTSILNIAAVPSLTISNLTGFGVGTYPLIKYTNGTVTGFSNLPLHPTSPLAGYVLTTQNNITTNTIELLVQRNTTAVWSGAEDQLWNTLTHPSPKNWVDLVGTPTDFAHTFDVTFDTTATGYSPKLDGTMYPQSVTFNNSTANAYTLGLQNGLSSDKISNIPTVTGISGDTDGTTGVITNITSTTGLLAGMAISGSGIPTGATIQSVDSPTQITISLNTTSVNLGTPLTGGPANGATTFTKSGTGLVILNTPYNDFTGGSTMNAGILQFGASTSVSAGAITGGPLGTGAILLNGGTLQDDGSARNLANALTIAGNATFGTTGGGSLTFTNEVTGNSTTLTTSPVLTVNNTTTFQQVISGSGRSITKAGTGTLVFTAVNTYNGGTTVNAGSLSVTSTGGLASGSNLTIASGATADFANSTQTLGTLSNNGLLNLNTASETVTVTTLNGASTGDINFVGGSNTLTAANGTYAGSIDGNGSLVKSGSGADTLNLTNGGSTYTGGTTVNASSGTLGIGASTTSGATITSGPLGTGTVSIATGNTINTLNAPQTLANAISLNAAAISFTGNDLAINGTGLTSPTKITLLAAPTITVAAGTDVTFNSVVDDGVSTFALTKAGNGGLFLLNANNTYSGVTTINAGILGVSSLETQTGTAGTNADSLGNSSNAATNLVFGGNSILQYLGTGSTTDRQFTINSGVTATIDSSGTGPLVMNSTAAVGGSGARNIVLTGTNTGVNEIDAIIGLTTGTLTKNGTGTWFLNQVASTYTGVTAVNAGTLQVTKLAAGGSNSSIGASTNVAANLVVAGGATLKWVGSTNDSTDHALTLNSNGSAATIDASGTSGAVLTFSSTGTLANALGGNSVTVLALDGTGGTSTTPNSFAPLLANTGTGAAALIKNGTGAWQVTSASTFTGATTINNGTLVVSNIQNSNVASNIGQSSSAAGNLVIGSATTPGTLRYVGTGGVNNSSDHLFTVGAAGGTIDASGASGTPLSFTNVGTLVMGAATTTARTLTLTGSNTDNNNITSIIPNGTGAGLTSLAKTGDGTWQLSGVNTYTGATTISGGTLKSNVNGAINAASAVTVAAASPSTSATWDLTTRTQTSNSITLGGVANSTPTITGTTGSALTLGGNVTYDATSNPGAGTISVASLALGTAARTFTVGDSTNATKDLTIGSVISSGTGGSLVKAGAGTLEVTAANTYTGGTTVNAGTLLVNNTTGSGTGTGAVTVNSTGTLGGSGIISGNTTVNAGGLIAPGAAATTAGTLTIGGSTLTLAGAGSAENRLVIDYTNATGNIPGLTPAAWASYSGPLLTGNGGQANDLLNLTAATTNFTWNTGGQLSLNQLGSSYSWVLGDVLNMLDWTALSGGQIGGTFKAFDSGLGGDMVLPSLGTGLSWDTSRFISTGAIAVIPEPSRALLILFGLLGLGLRRRRR